VDINIYTFLLLICELFSSILHCLSIDGS